MVENEGGRLRTGISFIRKEKLGRDETVNLLLPREAPIRAAAFEACDSLRDLPAGPALSREKDTGRTAPPKR